ncbi:MAG: heavy metal-associated domain-containing protein [Deltaproteobacteria bacterium]|jgi:copper chaperone CopZ|nr:heavy metal-associated domain-containing protein [Deltaproteobacteria bacterium]
MSNTYSAYIPRISCKHCAHTIQMELMELPGVKSVQVDVERKGITVIYDPPASEKAIKDLLVEINYAPSSS